MSFERFFFGKHTRLSNAAEFNRVFSKPIKIFGPHFIFLVRKNYLDYPRLGFAVSVKKVRKSVTRNVLKRIVRESFRLNQHCLGNFDIVVIACTKASSASKCEIQKSVNKHWERIKKS